MPHRPARCASVSSLNVLGLFSTSRHAEGGAELPTPLSPISTSRRCVSCGDTPLTPSPGPLLSPGVALALTTHQAPNHVMHMGGTPLLSERTSPHESLHRIEGMSCTRSNRSPPIGRSSSRAAKEPGCNRWSDAGSVSTGPNTSAPWSALALCSSIRWIARPW